MSYVLAVLILAAVAAALYFVFRKKVDAKVLSIVGGAKDVARDLKEDVEHAVDEVKKDLR